MFWFFKKKKKSVADIICEDTGLRLEQLNEYLSRGEKNYTPHKLTVKNKTRTVYEPEPKLRDIQILAVKKILKKYPVSPHTTAYEKGCSIFKNAARHRKNGYLAHYDISDFFGSIKYRHFEDLLSKDYETQDIKLLWLICSLNDGLPLGAYSSPFAANRVMRAFDIAIAKTLKKTEYTRYADDMVFSSKRPLSERLESEVKDGLYKLKMSLNAKKTFTYTPKSPKKVTGVIINHDGALTVGKKFKQALKKKLYKLTVKKKGNRQKIMGRLAFLKSIEPGYYNKLLKKYGI